MNKDKFFKISNIWVVSLWSLDLLMFLYLLISGRVYNSITYNDFIAIILMAIAALSLIMGGITFVMAIIEKKPTHLGIGALTIVGSGVLYLFVIVMALANFWG